MNNEDILENYDLSNSLLLGFYGGGNYGDELLLEVIASYLSTRSIQNIKFIYRSPAIFPVLHRDFGYALIPGKSIYRIMHAVIVSRVLIVGGGGFWGRDVNINTLLMSTLLLVGRIFRKKVYLLGVGYYSSTNYFGHVCAYIAALGSSKIIARDSETFHNFKKFSRNVSLGADVAMSINEKIYSPYKSDAEKLGQDLGLSKKRNEKTILIGFRRFHETEKFRYENAVREVVAANLDKHIILAIFEPMDIDAENYSFILKLQAQYKKSDIRILEGSHNPLVIYSLIMEYAKQLIIISPQFHVVLTALLSKAAIYPIYYDNKVRQLLLAWNIKNAVSFREVEPKSMNRFIVSSERG